MSLKAYPRAMRRLINELSKLPSIGQKSAHRLAYHVIVNDEKNGTDLARAISEAQASTRLCQTCFALCENEICEICADETRNTNVICVVEKPADLIAIEEVGTYRGLYHVLHGLWSPLRGVSPEKTHIAELIERVKNTKESNPIEEIILATSTTVEGDATAMYIANAVEGFDVEITRIAQGMPKGGELEYADSMTLNHALQGRKVINS